MASVRAKKRFSAKGGVLSTSLGRRSRPRSRARLGTSSGVAFGGSAPRNFLCAEGVSTRRRTSYDQSFNQSPRATVALRNDSLYEVRERSKAGDHPLYKLQLQVDGT